MIKFFRRIRRRLLTESKPASRSGKFGRYLLYAIGETLLVVVGILIALQVNRQNDFQNNRKQEQTILNNILRDLSTDHSELRKNIAYTQYHLSVLDTMLREISFNPNYKIVDFARHNGNFPYHEIFAISKGTYMENLSSGKISLILSDSLREEIFQYYELRIKDIGADIAVIATMNSIMPIWYDILGPSQEFSLGLGLSTNLPNLVLEEIAANPKYQVILMQKYAILGGQIEDWNQFKSINEHLVQSIERELKARWK